MATRLGNVAVGTVVKIKENGTPVDYIVAQQGRPKSSINLYDASCTGTWVMRVNIYTTMQWSNNTNSENTRVDYSTSTVSSYLNSSFKNVIDIRDHIKTVKLPYTRLGVDINEGTGIHYPQVEYIDGANGMVTQVFLLAKSEMDASCANNSSHPNLAVFKSFPAYRTGYLNGQPYTEWYRTVSQGPPSINWNYVECNLQRYPGDTSIMHQNPCTNSKIGVRPAFILDPDGLVEEDGTITYNQAPTTPGSLTVPETVLGGKPVSLSWSASTDPDGNLEGYMVERSLDGGTSWTQIYQGSALSTANTVPFGSETVRYRVKAYDSEGAASGYQTSPVRVVVNNLAPDVPEGLTLPDIVQGGAELSIIWGEATDSDGNLAGYSLERQVDGGQWTEVYNGEAANYTDSIPKGQWQTVAYRVRAYDSFGAYGGYAATETLPVNNNTPPEITSEVGADLGEKSAGFSFLYQVSDEEKDPITVTETVDDTTLRCFTVEGAEQSFSLDGEDFLVLANGSHTLKIAANDGHSGAVHEVVFTKSVTEITATLRAPMEADGQITLCVLSVNGEIPPDAVYSVMVTNNAKDASPVWEDCTAAVKNGLNHIFENSAAANGFAFNFQVRAARGTSGQGGYIASIQGGFQ